MARRPAACHPDQPHYAFEKCRSCYKKTNGRESERAAQRRWRAANKDKLAARGRRYRAAHPPDPGYHRAHHLRTKFGMTVAAFDAMLEAQGGVCAICGGTNKKGRPLVVDHDHRTGRIRALLCTPCNAALGAIERDLFPAFMAYIEEHAA